MNISLGNFLGDLASSTTQIFDSLSGVITLIIGMLLAFWVLSFIIGTLTGNDDDDIING